MYEVSRFATGRILFILYGIILSKRPVFGNVIKICKFEIKDYKKNVYSRLPITRTFSGNRKGSSYREFELSGVRVTGS